MTFSHIYLTFYQFAQHFIPNIIKEGSGEKSALFLYDTPLQILYLVVGVVAGNIGWEFASQIKQNKDGALVRLFDAAVGFVFFTTLLSLIASVLSWFVDGYFPSFGDVVALMKIYHSKLGAVLVLAIIWYALRHFGLKTSQKTSGNPISS